MTSSRRETTRRALLAAIAGGGVAAGTLSPVTGYLQDFAPLTGDVWKSATTEDRTVESPHGPATVRYDDAGVPHIEADDEATLFYAAGYAQAADRLFQMDLQRRVMRGQLSEVVGDATLDSDEFNRRMGFAEAAAVTWDAVKSTPAGDSGQAFADGVNAYIDDGPLPPEFALLDYEPRPWEPVDSILMQKQISWGLTGSFHTIRRARLEANIADDVLTELYPRELDHNYSIIRDADGGLPGDAGTNRLTHQSRSQTNSNVDAPPASLLSWVGAYETQPWIGSNSWGIHGDHTDTGRALVANDPHLTLMAPPVWYEMHLVAPELDVRGVTFPGVPLVVIGQNQHGAWGFTNVGADVIDFYQYETRDGEYRYGDEWREYETTQETITVKDGENVTITRRETVHGPVLEREGYEVAVAWTGHGPTRTMRAVYHYNKSTGYEDFREATRLFDEPTQNLVYGDADGNLLYFATGVLPIRRIDSDVVPGNQIFDGSEQEGEWAGFTPFESADWTGDGFVPFEEKPHLDNPDFVGTANQRLVDDPAHYIGESFADPYRGMRVYQAMDERFRSNDPFDRAFCRRLHDDAVDLRTEGLLDDLVDAAAGAGSVEPWLSALRDWDGAMRRDSRAALVFRFFFEEYRRLVAEPILQDAGLDPGDSSLYPRSWVIQHLDDDATPFEDRRRGAILSGALLNAVDTIEEHGYEVYGDYNTTGAITHPFDQGFLNYPDHPTDGSAMTVNNYRRGDPEGGSVAGSSWRMVVDAGRGGKCILPGGNDGVFLSDHYDDQVKRWADTQYRDFTLDVTGDVRYTFRGDDQ